MSPEAPLLPARSFRCFRQTARLSGARALCPLPARPTGFIAPCLPTSSRTEVKHNGYRFIARRDGDRVRVFSRNARDWADRVPLIVEAMLALPVTSVTIDGESGGNPRAVKARMVGSPT